MADAVTLHGPTVEPMMREHSGRRGWAAHEPEEVSPSYSDTGRGRHAAADLPHGEWQGSRPPGGQGLSRRGPRADL